MVSEEKKILALYDCRSKQEYIYRTNRVKEIIGASMLLTDLFKEFFVNNKDFKLETEWKENSNAPENYLDYFEKSGLDGEIVYEGGGNLCIIYRNYETYIKVNQQLSKKVLEKTFGVSIIAAYTEVSGNFVEDRKKLYDLTLWEGDKIFLRLLENDDEPFFLLKLGYDGDELVSAVLNGTKIV